LRVVLARRVLGGEFGAERLGGALHVHNFGDTHPGEVELHRQRFGEEARIAVGDARAAALAHADFDDAERLERTQRIAGDDPACAEARRQVLFRAEEVARPKPLANSASRTRATTWAGSEDRRPANTMRAVESLPA